ncbi:hypothetical protein MUB16_28510 [Priestia sp. OVL9]|nr:hypothetical protein [Priestia sp. OVL9]
MAEQNEELISLLKQLNKQLGRHKEESKTGINNTTFKDAKQSVLNMYEEKTKRKKVEDTHIKRTYYIERELDKRLNKLAKGKRGFKTMFMNKAIESLLDEMEK